MLEVVLVNLLKWFLFFSSCEVCIILFYVVCVIVLFMLIWCMFMLVMFCRV